MGLSRRTLFNLLLLVLASCGAGAPQDEAVAPPPATPDPAAIQDAWWQRIADLCGQSYAGRIVSADATDADLAEQPMVMHVRRCAPERSEIPFHVGEDRSRTWVLTRTDTGIELKHDHRHEDGSPDAVTYYGGHTAAGGSETEQSFPADAHFKTLFAEKDLQASTANVWSIEIEPGVRFSYILRRPERFFRADFDLSAAVETPPEP